MTKPSDRSALGKAESRIQELIASRAPLKQTLEELVKLVEGLTPSGMIASILVLDREAGRLRHGAGPSLPDAYNAAIDGLEIGPEVGSCGTAAFHDKTVSVYDIANDRLWKNFRELALQHGLRACWSTPIHGADGAVLGTFANYYRVVRDPSPIDLALTGLITKAAAAAIEQSRTTEPVGSSPA
jgi:GAF domain-containing protein